MEVGGEAEEADAFVTAPFQTIGATDRLACNRAVSGPCSAEPGKEARGAWPLTLAESERKSYVRLSAATDRLERVNSVSKCKFAQCRLSVPMTKELMRWYTGSFGRVVGDRSNLVRSDQSFFSVLAAARCSLD